MSMASFSIQKRVIVWVLVLICFFGGLFAYFNLGRYEDPEYTIKEALVVTQYKGATPKEVEQEVTDRIEKKINEMGQIKRLESISKPGISEITVVIKDKYDKHALPQVWDELRRKINDVQAELPPGTSKSIVHDDYGDVFGMYAAITGDGYSYRELKKFADVFKRELTLVPGVSKINLDGVQEEAIFVDISRNKMAQLGISLEQIYKTLKSQNLVAYAGEVRVGDEYIRIEPTGSISSVQAISNLVLRSNKTKKLISLKDIAKVSRGYVEVPDFLVYYNGKPAVTLGISIISGGNVVKIGNAIAQRLTEIDSMVPVGVKAHPVYNQPILVDQSVTGFMISLAEALAIVVIVLFAFMGWRSGVVISAILLLSVFGTLFIMYLFGIDLERISLGALIIALGMLVDNAIVVTEGILIKTQLGESALIGAEDTLKQTMWPLLGATIVGILAFAAIGLSQDSTGEYTRSLFYVILISLMLSWVLAVLVTPLFCNYLFKPAVQAEQKDPYAGFIYRFYKGFLKKCIRFRWATVVLMIGLLGSSIYAFKYVDQTFFPDSTTSMFYLDYWRSQGTDVRATNEDMQKITKHLRAIKGVKNITTTAGKGAERFMLVYEPEKPNTSYGQFIVEVNNYHDIPQISEEAKKYIQLNYPDTEPKIRFVRLGPNKGSKVEVRFSGPNPQELRKLSNQAQAIMRATPGAIDVRDDWRAKVKVIEPEYSEQQARLTGITRAGLSKALEFSFTGRRVGVYREKDELIPIITRPPDEERLDVQNIENLQVWSPYLQKTLPVGQIVSGFKTVWQNSIIRRRNQKLTITASSEPDGVLASVIMDRIKAKVEAIKLPPAYEMQWGGEFENSRDAQVALAAKLPANILFMFLIVVMLFNAVKQPVIIWLCVPLSFVGVTFGLLATGQPFGFMALLGFLSLSGMLIKNAIVLVEQIDLEIESGKDRYQAIIDSSVGRMRPVSMAAITTVLGMIPLLFDAFFVSMAVVIMAGLTFATILTLIIVPVLYSIFFKIPSRPSLT